MKLFIIGLAVGFVMGQMAIVMMAALFSANNEKEDPKNER